MSSHVAITMLTEQNSRLQNQIFKLNDEIKKLKTENTSLYNTIKIGSRPNSLKIHSLKLNTAFQLGTKNFVYDSILLFKLIHITNTHSLVKIKITEPQNAPENPVNRTTFRLVLGTPFSSFSRLTTKGW